MAQSLTRDEASFAEQLPFHDILDGVVFLNNGQVEVGVEIRSINTLLLSSAELDSLNATLTNVLRHAVPQDERMRLLIEATPMRQSILQRYQKGLATDHPSAHLLTVNKVRNLDATRKEGNLVEYRFYVTCTLSPQRKRKRGAVLQPW